MPTTCVACCCIAAYCLPALTALWQIRRWPKSSDKVALGLCGLALLGFGLLTSALDAMGARNLVLAGCAETLRALCVLAIVSGGWIYGCGRVALVPRFRPVRRWLVPGGFLILCLFGWTIADGRASGASVLTRQSVAGPSRATWAVTQPAALEPDSAESSGSLRDNDRSATWEQCRNARMQAAMPVFLAVFLVLVVLAAVSVIWS